MRGHGEFFANIQKNEKIYQRRFEGSYYLITKTFDNIEWEIHKETKEILGYKVLKATAEVQLNQKKKGEVIAWFAPEIPFQFGPINYGKLPGIILELQIAGYAHYANEINLSEKSRQIKEPKKGKRLSTKEYDKVIMQGLSF